MQTVFKDSRGKVVLTETLWNPATTGAYSYEAPLDIPLRKRKPTTYVVSDLFHRNVSDEFIDRVYAVMALRPQHTFHVATRWVERMARYTADAGRLTMISQAGARMGRGAATMRFGWPLVNVWHGATCGNQATFDLHVQHLLKVPTVVRFLSLTPLVGPFNLIAKCPPEFRPYLRHDRINWVAVSGESGSDASVCNINWIRAIRDQCKGLAAFFNRQLGVRPVVPDLDAVALGRQWVKEGVKGRSYGGVGDGTYMLWLNSPTGSDMAEWPKDLRVRELPNVTKLIRAHKRRLTTLV